MLASREVDRSIRPKTRLDPDPARRCRKLCARYPRSPAGRDGWNRTGRRSSVRRSGCCASCRDRWEGRKEGVGENERRQSELLSVTALMRVR